MASIDHRPDGRYRVRWREADGRQRARHFKRAVDARRWKTEVEHSFLKGQYVDPDAGKVPLSQYLESWLALRRPTWRASTAYVVESNLRKHVVPTLGERPLASIRRTDIEALYASLPLAASTISTVHQHLTQLLAAAVESGTLARNPAAKALLPKVEASKAIAVDLKLLEAVTANLPPWLRAAVPLGMGAGLRQAETMGLKVSSVDLKNRRVAVTHQLISRQVPEPVLGPPKTPKSYRVVPMADFVVAAVAAHLESYPGGPNDFLFRLPAGGPVDANRFGAEWRKATKALAPGIRYHDTRHTFATLLLSRGVSVKAVSEWLGHSKAGITLDIYAHAMPSDEEVARRVLDDALLADLSEDQVRTAQE